MRAAWYSKNGSASEVLQVGELPVPDVGANEVRVRVHVSGVNPSDVKSRLGRPITSGLIVPHSDGAGVIDQVGSDVSPKRVGERVWVWNGQWQRPMGTAAEYIVLPQEQAVHLPDNADFEAGACLGIPALTAFHAIRLAGDIQGKAVLVIGAASSVGYYAAQFALLKGAHVIGTAGSPEKTAGLADIGIHDTIDYKNEPVAERIKALTGDRGVDAVIDMDFSTTERLAAQAAIATHGMVVCYGSNSMDAATISFRAWLTRSLTLRFFLVYDLLDKDRQFAVAQINDLLSRGVLRHNIGTRFALDQIVQAHEAVEAPGVWGNVLVSPILATP